MPVPGSRGSPTLTSASAAARASAAAPRCSAGTSALRMAVHFWPALTVISLTISAANRSNSGVPGTAQGASTAALSESASALNRTARSSTPGCARSRRAVAAEPVKAMLSCPSRLWSRPSSSSDEAHTSCSEPSGIRPEPMMSRTAASAR